MAPLCFYRREVFELCGRLDEDFFAYLEDLDLALRAHLLGYTGIYLPDAVAYHIGSATLGKVLHPRIVEYLTRNQIYLLVKDYPCSVFLRLVPRIVVYQCLWLVFVFAKGGPLGVPARMGWRDSRSEPYAAEAPPVHSQASHHR